MNNSFSHFNSQKLVLFHLNENSREVKCIVLSYVFFRYLFVVGPLHAYKRNRKKRSREYYEFKQEWVPRSLTQHERT